MPDRISIIPGDSFTKASSFTGDLLVWWYDATDRRSCQVDSACEAIIGQNKDWKGIQLQKDQQERWAANHSLDKYEPICWLKNQKVQNLKDHSELAKLKEKYFTSRPKPVVNDGDKKKLCKSRVQIKDEAGTSKKAKK